LENPVRVSTAFVFAFSIAAFGILFSQAGLDLQASAGQKDRYLKSSPSNPAPTAALPKSAPKKGGALKTGGVEREMKESDEKPGNQLPKKIERGGRGKLRPPRDGRPGERERQES
jgi:hypothetical protein